MAFVMLDGISCPVANIFCIGRNYSEHATELGNKIETEPLVFLKPTSALLHEDLAIVLPSYSTDVHYECELVVLIKDNAQNIAEKNAMDYVSGYGIGLDLTARDVQTVIKAKGHPWAKSKGFRGAACISHFVNSSIIDDPQSIGFSLNVNGETRQSGNSSNMIFSIAKIISYLSHIYGLSAGDIIYTGTPAGVAAIHPGDILEMNLHGFLKAQFKVAA